MVYIRFAGHVQHGYTLDEHDPINYWRKDPKGSSLSRLTHAGWPFAAAKAGTLEMWGTGTAAVISPVGELGFRGERHAINGGKTLAEINA